jgi:AraC-like DNA-binding protein
MLSELQVTVPHAYGLAIYPPGATFGPRKMIDFEFVWIIEGDAQYSADSVSVPAPAGTIVLCRPNTVDAFRWDAEHRTRHGYFHFNVTSLPKNWPPLHEWPLARMPQEGDVLRPLFQHLMTWGKNGNPLLAELSVAHMLSAFVCGEIGSAQVPRQQLPDAVERAMEFIYTRLEEEPAAEIDLTELAGEACVTPEHLCRLFKAAISRSPLETVRLARLDRAAMFLSRSNYSVGEIAGLCGFASQFHFSRRFKEAFGRSPRQLRTEIQAGGSPPIARLLRWTPLLKDPSARTGKPINALRKR